MTFIETTDLIYKPYPMLVFDTLMPAILALPGVQACVTRMLNATDPNGTVGMSINSWVPSEMMIGPFEPVSGAYTVTMQAMTKNTHAGEGEIRHYQLADSLRRLLYRDTALRAALGALVVDDEMLERTLKWEVLDQQFANNQIGREFVFLSNTTLSFTTQLVC